MSVHIQEEKTYIYHTWNIDNKGKQKQKREYEKFISFLENVEKSSKIIFISTKSKKESWYVYYKHLAESYLISNFSNCLVLRFPTLIGKGTLVDLKRSIVEPYGTMELMAIDDAVNNIIDNLNYKGFVKSTSFDGEYIKAKTVFEILKIN